MNSLNVDPSGGFLYVADPTGLPQVTGFKIGPGAALTRLAGSPFEISTESHGGLALGEGSTLFAISPYEAVQALKRSATGALTGQQSPAPVRAGAEGGALTPDGKNLVVWSGANALVEVYSVAPDGAITLRHDTPQGFTPGALTGGVIVER